LTHREAVRVGSCLFVVEFLLRVLCAAVPLRDKILKKISRRDAKYAENAKKREKNFNHRVAPSYGRSLRIPRNTLWPLWFFFLKNFHVERTRRRFKSFKQQLRVLCGFATLREVFSSKDFLETPGVTVPFFYAKKTSGIPCTRILFRQLPPYKKTINCRAMRCIINRNNTS